MNRQAPVRMHVESRAAGKFIAAALAVLAATATVISAVPLAAQDDRNQEIAATLAVGRVIFCVTRDAIVVAAVEGGGEAGSRPPAIVPLGSGRIGVVLGADEWANPSSGAKSYRLDAELAHLAAIATQPAAVQPQGPNTLPVDPNQPTAIEDIGIDVLEALRGQVTQIHRKLDLAADEPLVELLLADYVVNYGPEVWSVQYHIRQKALGNDYWETTPVRPSYVQLYPPEKGRPRSFMEERYPANSSEPTLLALLLGHDSRIDPITHSSTELIQAITAIEQGDSRKAQAAAVADFLRAALPVVTSANARMAVAKLDPDHGFQWLVQPAEPLPAPTQDNTPRQPEAPSLRGHQQRN